MGSKVRKIKRGLYATWEYTPTKKTAIKYFKNRPISKKAHITKTIKQGKSTLILFKKK